MRFKSAFLTPVLPHSEMRRRFHRRGVLRGKINLLHYQWRNYRRQATPYVSLKVGDRKNTGLSG
jgi:hypothetical protein